MHTLPFKLIRFIINYKYPKFQVPEHVGSVTWWFFISVYNDMFINETRAQHLYQVKEKIITYQKANVVAERVIILYTKGPAIESASLCIGASWP